MSSTSLKSAANAPVLARDVETASESDLAVFLDGVPDTPVAAAAIEPRKAVTIFAKPQHLTDAGG